jgi:BirA family biotin operon repressor/biotin-[acetyl-CoA-carboxylase] ligase
MIQILSLYDIKGKIKYPNDIYVNNKKIIGMLLSNIQIGKSEQIPYQSLSIGINVNSIIDIKTIDKQAKVSSTSIFLEIGKESNREKLLKLIIDGIDPVIQRLTHQ